MKRYSLVLVLPLLFSLVWAKSDDDSTGTHKGWLGVYTEGLSKPMLAALDIGHGVLVTEVAEESPAAKAGITMGDVIMSVDGVSLDDPQALRRVVRGLPGRKVEAVVRRKGKEQRLNATLESRRLEERVGDFGWQNAPLEAVREARKTLKQFGPERRDKVYRESMDSLRKELEGLKRELAELKEKLRKQE
jgi:membrane-associated protease RseP (regulator of RpoE activity)